MTPADLPAPRPGQTYQDYLTSVVLAAAERWGRWKAEQGPESEPWPIEARVGRQAVLDFAAEPEGATA